MKYPRQMICIWKRKRDEREWTNSCQSSKDWRKHYLQMKLRICISFASAFSSPTPALPSVGRWWEKRKKEKKKREENLYLSFRTDFILRKWLPTNGLLSSSWQDSISFSYWFFALFNFDVFLNLLFFLFLNLL